MDNWKRYILSFIWSSLLVAQFILIVFLGWINEKELDLVIYIG